MTRRGDTLLFDAPPTVAAWAAAGGKKESEGPLASAFDFVTQDAAFGEQGCENWEQAESLLQRKAVELCLRKADIPRSKVDIAFAGDLQAQCTASNYTMRELGIPFAGVYGACSTMAETLGLAAVFAAGGMAERVLALTSSHFCAAERQFRTPLEYGAKRTPTAQWTATAAGACLVRAHGSAGVPVLSVTFGRVQDFAVHDINNMGAAMMPAAASTLLRYFSATGTSPQDFDAIFTGDLGEVGTALLHEQMAKEGLPLDNHKDCGCLLYDTNSQNVQAGGSGAGCSAAVLCGKILPMLAAGQLRRVLFLATGALMALPLVTPGSGWSDAARIASGEIEPYEALISEFILNNYTPFTATLLAMIPVFCFWLTMVFVILMFGVWGSPVFGVLMYAFLMVANVTILFEAFPFQLILPIQYATLDNILSGYDGKEIQQFLKVIGVNAALIVSLIAVMMISVKRVELNFHAESKQ